MGAAHISSDVTSSQLSPTSSAQPSSSCLAEQPRATTPSSPPSVTETTLPPSTRHITVSRSSMRWLRALSPSPELVSCIGRGRLVFPALSRVVCTGSRRHLELCKIVAFARCSRITLPPYRTRTETYRNHTETCTRERSAWIRVS